MEQRAFVEKLTGAGDFPAVLDFGGGFGGALAAFPESERFIYEMDPLAREHLETLKGVEVLGPELFEDEAFKGRFDLIILSHVLEHMRDPLFELERLQTMLKPEGYLFLEVPTEDETVIRLQLENMKPGLGHLFHFEQKTLKKMLAKAKGFDLVGNEQCGVSRVSFYEGLEKMAFGIDQNPDGIWLRAVMQRKVRAVTPAPKARKSAISPVVAESLFNARRRELEMLTAMRKTYRELASFIRENVPSAERVIGLDRKGYEKLFFMSEKARKELENQRKQASQFLAGTKAVEEAVRREREALKTNKNWAEKELAKAKTQLDEKLVGEQKRRETVEKELQEREKSYYALEEQNAGLQSENAMLAKEVQRLEDKQRGKVSILKADLERERSKVQSLNDEMEIKNDLYRKEVAEYYSRQSEEYSRQLETSRVRFEDNMLGYERALEEANAKIRRLATEYTGLLTLLQDVEQSTTFRVGSAITLPLRYIKTGKAALRQSLLTPPSQDELDRRSAPVKPVLPVVTGKPASPAPNKDKKLAAKEVAKPAILPTMSAEILEEEKLEQARLVARKVANMREFYEKNGFAIVRNVLTEREANGRAKQFKSDLVPDPMPEAGHTTKDVAAMYPPAQEYVFDPRVLAAVRGCLGNDIRFLQWATYQLNHMSFPWHRDGGYRTFNVGLDWDESQHKYSVAKIILYFECKNFSMGVYPRSHREDIDRTRISKKLADHEFVSIHNQRPGVLLDNKPYLAPVKPGDALIFDQRLFHCGRLTDVLSGEFTEEIKDDKSFLSLIYGADNPHSSRFYSYFNHERDFGVRPMQKSLVDRLEAAGLYLSTGQENYFDAHPEQREGLWLPEQKRQTAEFVGGK
ncbi:methyltransferase domain-containing protein [Henriciella aquimarina]|uniref:methyltransferase domain-containing protein n=1 Tax=Henriciella aquimarina TaxID=545261 RepID=UPI001301F870|nr:methyltransferase domain-containing protein [Henriciella aquimarina]